MYQLADPLKLRNGPARQAVGEKPHQPELPPQPFPGRGVEWGRSDRRSARSSPRDGCARCEHEGATPRRETMGDKGKKDKDKDKKQKTTKQNQDEKKKQEKQPKRVPWPGI